MKQEPQIEMFPTMLRLQRSDPLKNMHRFYLMTVQPDLFGGSALIREWGRIGSSGTITSDIFSDEGQAVDELARIAKQKASRGYSS